MTDPDDPNRPPAPPGGLPPQPPGGGYPSAPPPPETGGSSTSPGGGYPPPGGGGYPPPGSGDPYPPSGGAGAGESHPPSGGGSAGESYPPSGGHGGGQQGGFLSSASPGGGSKNWMGITALVLGVVSLLLGFCAFAGFWAGIPAIILGILAFGAVRKGQANNRGLALAGVITGALGLLLTIGVLVFVVAFGDRINSYSECIERAGNDQQEQQQCAEQFGR